MNFIHNTYLMSVIIFHRIFVNLSKLERDKPIPHWGIDEPI